MRLVEFDPCEDAIAKEQNWLYHSVLTPTLNTVLMTPAQMAEVTMEYASNHNMPLNSTEGFIRQVIGVSSCVQLTLMLALR